jgi:hypothetical protein
MQCNMYGRTSFLVQKRVRSLGLMKSEGSASSYTLAGGAGSGVVTVWARAPRYFAVVCGEISISDTISGRMIAEFVAAISTSAGDHWKCPETWYSVPGVNRPHNGP